MDSSRWKQIDEVLQLVLDLPAMARDSYLRTSASEARASDLIAVDRAVAHLLGKHAHLG